MKKKLKKGNIWNTAKWIVLISEQSNIQPEKVQQRSREPAQSPSLHPICRVDRKKKAVGGGIWHTDAWQQHTSSYHADLVQFSNGQQYLNKIYTQQYKKLLQYKNY